MLNCLRTRSGPRCPLWFAVGAIAALGGVAATAAADLVSADGVWTSVDQVPAEHAALEPWIRPQAFGGFTLDQELIGVVLAGAPMEFTPEAAHPLEFELPMPDGSFARFAVVESPVMEAELAARYPSIRTYLAQGIDQPAAAGRFDWTPNGFHAMVRSPEGTIFVDPYSRGHNGFYASYYKEDYAKPEAAHWECLTDHLPRIRPVDMGPGDGGVQGAGVTLRKYRLANAATGEYTVFHGGTVEKGLAAVTTSVNRVNTVYEVDVAVRLVLIANNDKIIYTNGATDPYTNNDGFAMLNQNQSNLTSVIGGANYDIGHVFSTGGGGVAFLSCVCSASNKAKGVTGLPQPKGDPFDIDYVAHEMGHQFGANHPWNYCFGSNQGTPTWVRVEPGSGSTIMAYAGLCGADNLQNNSDAMMHSVSLQEINSFLSGAGNACAEKINTSNNPPAVNGGQDYSIPIGTPFRLIASGSDPDGDAITYSWEARDFGAAQKLTDPDNGKSPIFRPFKPTTSNVRWFPQLSDVIGNKQTKGEKLPVVNRTMTVRVTARDNKAGAGGVGFDDVQLFITQDAGPFKVTEPNTKVTWSGKQTVKWNVAKTDLLPVNAKEVIITLSTDSGQSFPHVLAEAAPNTGSAEVTLPNLESTKARIRVQGKGNIFYDMSDADFILEAAGACYADCTGDEKLDLFDFLCFTAQFNAGDPGADCLQDNKLDLFDFLCFTAFFNAGC